MQAGTVIGRVGLAQVYSFRLALHKFFGIIEPSQHPRPSGSVVLSTEPGGCDSAASISDG
jgi:hypothetical protein